ncbi:hypothetical protein N9611_01060 [Flavobacteriaceae bacterium]|nr:hypothetical protein [Flavobacteriaceae bacterium]
MNLIVYLFLGLITAVLGALPLGTTNVAVINTTIKENIHNALKIMYPAAIAEVILVLLAMYYNTKIIGYIDGNIWVQYSIAVVLLLAGAILFFRRKDAVINNNKPEIPKQLLGFILGMVNPAVLIYWILAISFLNKKIIHLDLSIEYTLLILFLVGVFFGKVVTLYGFGKFSHLLKLKINYVSAKVNQIIGVLLAVVSIIQFVKLIEV